MLYLEGSPRRIREAGLNCNTRPLALPDSMFVLLGRVFRQLRFWLKPSFDQKYPDFQIFFTKQILEQKSTELTLHPFVWWSSSHPKIIT